MIPFNTDAPIYHLPIATVALIIACTVLHFVTPSSLKEPEDVSIVGVDAAMLQVEVTYPSNTLLLQHGAGIKPWQWITSIFIHADIVHLIGNMIFLWAFGLVVEGKVGSLVFLGLYLVAGVGQSAVEQIFLSFASPGASLGASAAIFGLLGIALVWAPRNDFDVVYWFGFYIGTVEIPIMVFAFIKFAFEIIGMVTDPGGMASSIFHIMGLAIGIGLGFLWLKRDWVDCEGWDLVSVWQGDEGRREAQDDFETEATELIRQSTRGRSSTLASQAISNAAGANSNASGARPESEQPATTQPAPMPSKATAKPKSLSRIRKKSSTRIRKKVEPRPSKLAKGVKSGTKAAPDAADLGLGETQPAPPSDSEEIAQIIASENFALAETLLRKRRSAGKAIELDQETLFALINGLLHAKDFARSLPLMSEHAARFEVGRLLMLLNQAKILIKMERPRKALKILKSGANLPMDEATKKSFKQLARAAKRQIDEGVIELGDS